MDTTDNIITSIALAGFFDNMYSFYRITKGNKLINLGHGFPENPKDSTQYDRAIRRILSDLKEKERFLKLKDRLSGMEENLEEPDYLIKTEKL